MKLKLEFETGKNKKEKGFFSDLKEKAGKVAVTAAKKSISVLEKVANSADEAKEGKDGFVEDILDEIEDFAEDAIEEISEFTEDVVEEFLEEEDDDSAETVAEEAVVAEAVAEEAVVAEAVAEEAVIEDVDEEDDIFFVEEKKKESLGKRLWNAIFG